VLTTDRNGVADKAYYFDGGNTYIEGINPGNNLPVGSQQRTIACWVQSTESIRDLNIFHYGTIEVAPTNYHLFLNQGKYVGIGNGYGYGTLISSNDIGDNTWHFVTGVYEGESTNFQHIFIDGKLDVTATISTTPNTVLLSNWKMGRFMAPTQSLMGKIDDLRILNIALNDEDILNLYLSETTAPVLQQPTNQSTATTLTPLFQWSSSLTDAEFRLQLSADSTFGSILFDEVTTGLTTQLPGGLLSAGQNYYWRVRTTLNKETGPWSEVWRFTFLHTGLKSPLQIPSSFTISPNPADASVKISYSVPMTKTGMVPVTIEILNSIGVISLKTAEKKMMPGNYDLKLETTALQTGIYYCRLKAGDYSQGCKLFIIH